MPRSTPVTTPLLAAIASAHQRDVHLPLNYNQHICINTTNRYNARNCAAYRDPAQLAAQLADPTTCTPTVPAERNTDLPSWPPVLM